MSSDQELSLAICIPVSLRPKWETEYSTYESIPCPDCGERMWIGIRQKIMVDQGKAHATCALCSIQKYGVTEKDIDRIQTLTDSDN
jgi:hypothetical protein